MTVISNHFDHLFFTECKFKPPLMFRDLNKSKILDAQHNYIDGKEYFDLLERLQLSSQFKIVVSAYQVGILPGHPLNETDEMIFLSKSHLIFDGVKRSVLQLTGYIEEPLGSNNFKPCEEMKRTFKNESLLGVDEPVTLFELEGVFKSPLSWADWEIESSSFYLAV